MSYRMNTFKTKPEPCEQTPWVKDGPVAESKTITVNETLDPAQQIEFQTGVDELMKVIQKTDAPQCGLPTPAQTPKATSATPDMSSPTSPATIVSTASKKTPKEKKYICNGPNCNKSFTQKTHLEIHRRTHSGERPYVSLAILQGRKVNANSLDLRVPQLWTYLLPAREPQGPSLVPFACFLYGRLTLLLDP